MTEEQVFLAALELANPEERTAYLDRACGGDAELRDQVQTLLAAHFRSGEFLDESAGKQIIAGLATPNPDNTTSVHFDAGGIAVAERKPVEASDALHFLEPPTRADSLGRIGHFEVLAVLGRGGFGIVFRAFDEALQRIVALKVLSPIIAATSPARKRFLREARSSAKVRHENVVQVYTVEEKPLPFLAMEFIPGETLQQRLDRTGPFDAADIVRISRQIAEGLAAAHANGLIHRDIKPGNILLESGTPERVKITDFGLARAADDASLSQSGTLAGTPMFMAPEQAKGEVLDHRADLFSLGSVMYVMATGRPPFRAATTFAVLKRVVEEEPRPIRDVIPEVPQWLCDIIARLHAKQPEDRFSTAREVADLLARCEAEKQPSGHIPAVPQKAPAKVERPKPVVAAPAGKSSVGLLFVAVVLLILVGGFAVMEATGVTNLLAMLNRPVEPETGLVVETDDPAITITIDGAELPMNGAKTRTLPLKPGTYTVEARKDGELVRRQLVAIAKDGREVVRFSQAAALPPPAPKKTPDPEPKEPKEKGPAGPWAVLKPVEMKSEGGARLTLQADRSVLVSGNHPDRDVYTLTFREVPRTFHGLRLEALPHDSLPDKGPGRRPDRQFVLSTIRAELDQPKGGPLPLKLVKAWGDFANDDSTPSHAIDADDDTGWGSEFGQPHYAVFEPEEPAVVPEGAMLRVTLEFKHGDVQRQLGCFRLSVATEKPVQQATAPPPPTFDAKEPQAAAAKQAGLAVETANSIGMKLRLIPAGKFTMGSLKQEIDLFLVNDSREGWEDGPIASEGPAHEVEITRPFYLGETDVTYGQFRQFVAAKNYAMEDDGWKSPGWEQTDDHPVVNVNWNNAVDFCKWLSEKEKKEYRLPTEAEWEYACRAGTKTRYAHGDREEGLLTRAWTSVNSEGRARPVKGLDANAWGLYDMHGNVWQWCQDWYGDDYYASSPAQDPSGPAKGTVRVLRGGSCNKSPFHCRSAFRNRASSGPRDPRIGFRVVLVVPPGGFKTGSATTVEPPSAAAPVADADFPWIAALPYAEQVEAVRKELKQRNPEFDGKLTPTIEGDRVTGLAFVTDRVTDVAPVRGLPHLRKLFITGSFVGKGSLADLSPLRGMKLTQLNIGENRVSDLSPLKGMPLTWLGVWQWQGTDLTPLQGMPLKWLNCGGGRQPLDLTPIAGLPLEYLCVNHTQVSDLTPLKAMPLGDLEFTNTRVTDFAPLRAIKTLNRINMKTVAEFWREVETKEKGAKSNANRRAAECVLAVGRIAWDGGVIVP